MLLRPGLTFQALKYELLTWSPNPEQVISHKGTVGNLASVPSCFVEHCSGVSAHGWKFMHSYEGDHVRLIQNRSMLCIKVSALWVEFGFTVLDLTKVTAIVVGAAINMDANRLRI